MAAELESPAEEEHLVVGRYRLFRRLGTGAMGVVWEGHDERLNRPVAVKKLLLHPGLSPRKAAEAVARCLREGRIAARLHHPNAITVFDVVDEDDVPCLVMEYLRSRSLATVLAEEGPLSPDKAADVGAQVAAALAAAHAGNIVHRDVTPNNILLGDDGSVKLTDFGISRTTDDTTVTKSGRFAGTPAYLAPEVALGEEPTSASDVFSLGSTLYAAVEGEPPFGVAGNTLGLLHAVAGGEIKPPKQAGPLTDVLTALLAADPQARPTAAEARELLATVARGDGPAYVPLPATPIVEPTSIVEPVDSSTQVIPPVATPVTPARRSHRPLAVVGVFLVALIAGGLWLLGGRDGLRPGEEQGPAKGTEQSGTAPGSPSDPVAPVRAGQQSAGTGQTPATDAGGVNPAAPATAETSITTTTAPPPPATTTEDAPVETTDTTTAPPASGEETTAPDTPDGTDLGTTVAE